MNTALDQATVAQAIEALYATGHWLLGQDRQHVDPRLRCGRFECPGDTRLQELGPRPYLLLLLQRETIKARDQTGPGRFVSALEEDCGDSLGVLWLGVW